MASVAASTAARRQSGKSGLSYAGPAGQTLASAAGPDGANGRIEALLDSTALARPTAQVQRAHLIEHLQVGYGNRHVGQVIARRAQAAPSGSGLLVQRDHCPPPPAASQPIPPHQDPNVQAVEADVNQAAAEQRAHGDAVGKSKEPEQAAKPPVDEIKSKAEGEHVRSRLSNRMSYLDETSIKKSIADAVEAAKPKDGEEAKKATQSGKLATEVKTNVVGEVSKKQGEVQKDIKDTNSATPSTAGIDPKRVTALAPEPAGPRPGSVGAGRAVPPASEISLQHATCEVNATMSAASVTDEQLAQSNEPSFLQARDAKDRLGAHAESAPPKFAADQTTVLSNAASEAEGRATHGLDAMHGSRGSRFGEVMDAKEGATADDETTLARFSTNLQAIFKETKTKVDEILVGTPDKPSLSQQVGTKFDVDEKAARDTFEQNIERRSNQVYETERLANQRSARGDIEKQAMAQTGRLLFGWPEIAQIIEDEKNKYITAMDIVVSNIAKIITTALNKAISHINNGKENVQKEFNGLAPALQERAGETVTSILDEFDALEGEVDAQKNQVVQLVAEKYVAARQEIERRADELKEATKGLLQRAIEFLETVGTTILELFKLLLTIFARVAQYIGDILKNPIAFFGNLWNAIKTGLSQFVANFVKHLEAALIGWLVGQLGMTGLQIPASLDGRGILSLVTQILGITYSHIRARVVRTVGEPVVAYAEKAFEIVRKLAQEGPAALWQEIQAQVGDLKANVVDQTTAFVKTTVIDAGVRWIIGMFAPASSFVRACQAIYTIAKFIVERAQQIAAFVNSVLDSVGEILAGRIQNAANMIESSLTQGLSLAISFLASLIGVSNLGARVRKLIEKAQAPINRAIDAILKPFMLQAKRKQVISRTADTKKDKKSEDSNGKILEQAKKDLEAVISRSKTTGDVDRQFGRIEAKYGIKPLRWVNFGKPSVHILMELNPRAQIYMVGNLICQIFPDTRGAPDFVSPLSPTILTRDIALPDNSTETAGTALSVMLTPHHAAKLGTGGTPRSNALRKTMSFLPTAPNLPAKNRYVRGHLLNHNIGGPGAAENLYPITAQANSDHFNYVEKEVKERLLERERYNVLYDVEVKNEVNNLSIGGGGHINADIDIRIWYYTADGGKRDFKRNIIFSRYDKKRPFADETETGWKRARR